MRSRGTGPLNNPLSLKRATYMFGGCVCIKCVERMDQELENFQYLVDNVDKINPENLDGWLLWVEDRQHPCTSEQAVKILKGNWEH